MTRCLARLLAVLLLSATTVGAASSCSITRTAEDGARPTGTLQTPALPAHERATAGPSIAQLGHGHRAHFATCTPPGCPAVTPKTLDVDSPIAPVSHVDARTASDPSQVTSLSLGGPIAGRSSAAASAAATGAPATSRARAVEPRVSEVVVTFPFGSAALAASARTAIDAAAAVPGIRRIDIRGRTDAVGPAAANDALARRRAAAVVQHLHMRHPHLASAFMHVDARGSCCYATGNDSPEGRARNRRVEIAFHHDATDP